MKGSDHIPVGGAHEKAANKDMCTLAFQERTAWAVGEQRTQQRSDK